MGAESTLGYVSAMDSLFTFGIIEFGLRLIGLNLLNAPNNRLVVILHPLSLARDIGRVCSHHVARVLRANRGHPAIFVVREAALGGRVPYDFVLVLLVLPGIMGGKHRRGYIPI